MLRRLAPFVALMLALFAVAFAASTGMDMLPRAALVLGVSVAAMLLARTVSIGELKALKSMRIT